MCDKLIYKIVITKNGQVGYLEVGSGEPLILLVGFSGTLFHWNNQFIVELAQKFKLYLIDNRLVGTSNSTNPNSMDGLAYDVVDFIEALAITKPYIFGWSMGGMITQALVNFYQDKLAGVILLATVPHVSYTNQQFFDLIKAENSMSEQEFQVQLYSMFFSEPADIKLKKYITSATIKIPGYSYRFELVAKQLQGISIQGWQGNSEATLNAIKIPTLIFESRDDLVVKSETAYFLFKHVPSSKLIIYSSGGHFFIHKNAQAIAKDIINYFL